MNAAGPVALSMTGLAKWWDEHSGLRPVTLEVAAGELVVVRGRSGSGKSTLLAIVAGWCPPDTGEVRVGGVVASTPSRPVGTGREPGGPGPMSWREVAIVPQVLALVPELTLVENVTEALTETRTPNLALESRVPTRRSTARAGSVEAVSVGEALERLDLVGLADRFPAEVSMGQQQRASVARAVVAGARVVLADEPTSHQDPHHATAVVGVLRAAAVRGSAVLVASHDPAVVAAADRVIDLTL